MKAMVQKKKIFK